MTLKKQHTRAGIIQDVGEFLGREADVERQQDSAGFDNAIVGFQQPMTVGAEERHAVPRLNSSFSQGACKAAHSFGKLGIGKARFSANDSGPVWRLLLGVAKKTNRRQRNIHRGYGPRLGGLSSIYNKSMARHKVGCIGGEERSGAL